MYSFFSFISSCLDNTESPSQWLSSMSYCIIFDFLLRLLWKHDAFILYHIIISFWTKKYKALILGKACRNPSSSKHTLLISLDSYTVHRAKMEMPLNWNWQPAIYPQSHWFISNPMCWNIGPKQQKLHQRSLTYVLRVCVKDIQSLF